MTVKNKTFALTLSCLALMSTCSWADDASTEGGLELYQSADKNYWFTMHGIMRVDGTFFIGDHQNRQNELPSGTSVRSLETTINGGIGDDFSYTTTFSFENGVNISDAFFTYHGFDNIELSFGQIVSPFCLENANSAKWIPFLERSLPVVALRPCMGIGANFTTWGSNYNFTFATATPPHGTNRDSATIMHRSDRFTNSARFVYAPYTTGHEALQLGISGVYAENNPTFRGDLPNTDGRRFSTRPEAKARNTNALIDSGNELAIKSYTELGLELATLSGPFLFQAEFLQTNIDRDNAPHLTFWGWYAQASYVLTGECKTHKMKNGSFSGIKPNSKYGAWEVAARHSMVKLNDKDIHGGKEYNTAFSLGWYANAHLKILGNYIFADIDPTRELGAARNPSPAKRHLQILGLRAQVVW